MPAIAVGLAVVATVRSGQPRRVAEVKGEVISGPVGTEGWVAWIEGDEQGCRLRAARGGGRPMLAAPALSGLAVAGETAFLTRAEGPETELLKVSLRSGSTERIAALTGPAAQMVAGGEWLCWREHRPAGLPGVPFVAAGAPINVIRARKQAGGQVSLVTPVTGAVELVGVRGDDLYWVERYGEGPGASTLIRRARLPHGEPETLVTEKGWRTAALAEDARHTFGGQALVWTAPSAEGAAPEQFCAVKRQALGGAETVLAHPEVAGDWLDPRASLLVSQQGIYVQDRYHLWRLGRERSDQRAVYPVPSALTSSSLVGDEQYLVLGGPGRQVVAVRAVGFWGRVRRGLAR